MFLHATHTLSQDGYVTHPLLTSLFFYIIIIFIKHYD